MMVELTGIPGAGKSTVLQRLKLLHESESFIFDIQNYMLRRTFLPLKGKVGYELLLFSRMFLLKSEDWYLLKYVLGLIKKSGNSFLHKINILRNTCKKLIIYRYVKERDEVFFIDEGVAHIPFTIFVDITTDINCDELKVLLSQIPSVEALLTIDAPDNILLKRVLERGKKGHRRIDFDSMENMESFMQQSREVLNYIQSHFSGYNYQNIEKDIDTKKIINELGLKHV